MIHGFHPGYYISRYKKRADLDDVGRESVAQPVGKLYTPHEVGDLAVKNMV
jgi:hypothetical protein